MFFYRMNVSQAHSHITALQNFLRASGKVIVAVSGGVDSMTLALFAARTLGRNAVMCHAVSPAVPPAATRRVRQVAARENWRLETLDAEEFRDEHYLSNPYNRCFHCKNNLYRGISARFPGTILSGTNLDDLDDFRPGLQAAEQFQVQHPFVACGLNKQAVREVCRALGYPELAELPAAPCLASRVETGLRIDAEALRFIDEIEQQIRRDLQVNTARCRVRAHEIAVELDEAALQTLPPQDSERWRRHIAGLAARHGLPTAISFQPYRRGSAFIQP